MASAMVRWITKGQFLAVDSSKHSVVLSTQDEENGIGMKPSELLLAAVGGCSAVDVVNILQKKRQQLIGLEIHINGEQDPDPPWTFRKIHVRYIVRGRDLSEKAVADAIRLSEEKYCSVSTTLSQAVEFSTEYQIVQEA
ncbi:MAG: OsmC family protein [Anaerolineae bacterium]